MTEKSFKSLMFYGPFIAGFILSASGWLWAWFSLKDIASPLIIHFSDYTGINQIGSLAEIHGLGITGIILTVVNLILARDLMSRDLRWARMLSGATLFMGALLFTALAAIISVNQ